MLTRPAETPYDISRFEASIQLPPLSLVAESSSLPAPTVRVVTTTTPWTTAISVTGRPLPPLGFTRAAPLALAKTTAVTLSQTAMFSTFTLQAMMPQACNSMPATRAGPSMVTASIKPQPARFHTAMFVRSTLPDRMPSSTSPAISSEEARPRLEACLGRAAEVRVRASLKASGLPLVQDRLAACRVTLSATWFGTVRVKMSTLHLGPAFALGWRIKAMVHPRIARSVAIRLVLAPIRIRSW